MKVVRTAALVVGTGALAFWLVSVASTDAPERATPATAASGATAETPLFDLASQAERLRARTESRGSSPRGSRNPFVFGDDDVVEPLPSAAEAPTGDPDEDTSPPIALIGMATHGGGEHVAILSGPAELFLATRGDTIADRFEVTEVSATGVVLRDVRTGSLLRLTIH